MTDPVLQNYIDHIDSHLQSALAEARSMQAYVQSTEGDSDLHRKLAFYLTPILNHWIVGAQAGNMKDLKETLVRRITEKEKEMTTTQTHQGDGQDVLTKPAP